MAAGLTEPRCASERGLAMGGGRPAERRFTVAGSSKSVARCHRSVLAYWKFESISLQRRVHVSRDFALPRLDAGFFARVCGPGRCSAVSRDGYRAVHGATRREYLCRAKFQYRGVDAAVA